MHITVTNETPFVHDDVTERLRMELATALSGLDDRIACVRAEVRRGSARYPTGEVRCVLDARLTDGPGIVAAGNADSPVVAAVAAAGKLGRAVRYYLGHIDHLDETTEAA